MDRGLGIREIVRRMGIQSVIASILVFLLADLRGCLTGCWQASRRNCRGLSFSSMPADAASGPIRPGHPWPGSTCVDHHGPYFLLYFRHLLGRHSGRIFPQDSFHRSVFQSDQSGPVLFRISYDDLKPGLNIFDVAFTADVIDSDQNAWGFMDYNDMWKNVWGVDWVSYAQNDISIGGAVVTNLYGSMGRRLGSRAYDILYHANGGEGELVCPGNPHASGTKATVLAPGDDITRKDHYFVGWNTAKGGDGDWYAPGDEVTIVDQDVDLYAQWKLNTKATTPLAGSKVWNDLDNASGKRPAIDANQGQPLPLELVNLNGYDTGGNLITWCVVETPPRGYEASYENGAEWNYMTDRAYQGGTIKNTLKNALITYRLNGGSYNGSSADITTAHKPGSRITIHEAPVREGYTFLYWEGSEHYPGQSYLVSEDHVFTAVWKKQDNNTPKSGKEDSGSNSGNSSSGDRDSSSSGDRDSSSSGDRDSAKTGDEANLPLFAGLFAAAVCLLSMLLYRRRRSCGMTGLFC